MIDYLVQITYDPSIRPSMTSNPILVVRAGESAKEAAMGVLKDHAMQLVVTGIEVRELFDHADTFVLGLTSA